MPQDTGRVLTDLSHPLIDTLSREVRGVLASGDAVEKTVETRPGIWYLLRISPYRREGATDQGVVATFVNVSALKRGQQDFLGSVESKKRQMRQ